MKPLACCKIRVNRGRLYVRVYVWRNLRELRAYRMNAQNGIKKCDPKATAFCMQHTWDCPQDPRVAEVHFSKTHLNEEVAHEFFHATIHWLSRLRKPLAMFYDAKRFKTKAEWDNEEIGAEIMEELVRKFYVFAYVEGLCAERRRCS